MHIVPERMTVWHLNHPRHGDKPWEVQEEANRRANGRARYGWFLQQGLGKTPLDLNDTVDTMGTEIDLNVVFVPNSFKLDWPLAPKEWGVPDLPVGYWPKHSLADFAAKNEAGLYAMNYEAVRSAAGLELDRIMRRRRVKLTIDESSAIKNPQSKTAKMVMSLAKMAARVRELNGTPIVQNVLDYFAQLKVLGELDRMNSFQFRNRFAVLGGYMGKQVQIGKMQNEDELYRILDRCSFRALKKDWRDLPPKIASMIHVEMTSRQRQHYDQMMEDFYTQVSTAEITADIVLTQMDKLRQISSGIVIQDGEAHQIVEPGENPKLQALLDYIAGGDHKVIVVHHYRETGRMIYKALQEAGLNPTFIQGQMKPEQLVENKARFNDDSRCRVLVGQEAATCRGHTLIGGTGTDRCTRMFFFENSFSLLERLQMEDRNHRGDQDQACDVRDVVASDMDQTALDILTGKLDQANRVDAVVAAVRRWRKK